MPREKLVGIDLERLTTRITQRAHKKLLAEGARRYRNEATRVPHGAIISELLEKHLPDADGDAPLVSRPPAPARERAKRKPQLARSA